MKTQEDIEQMETIEYFQHIYDSLNSLKLRKPIVFIICKDYEVAYLVKNTINLGDNIDYYYFSGESKIGSNADIVMEVILGVQNTSHGSPHFKCKVTKNRYGKTNNEITIDTRPYKDIRYFKGINKENIEPTYLDKEDNSPEVPRDYLTNEQLQAAIDAARDPVIREGINCSDWHDHITKLLAIQLKRAQG